MIRLRMAQSIYDRIQQFHDSPVEKASFILAHSDACMGNITSYISHCAGHYRPEAVHYHVQTPGHLELTQDCTRDILFALVDSKCNTLVSIHNHPIGPNGFSAIDTKDELQRISQMETLRLEHAPGHSAWYLLELLFGKRGLIEARLRSTLSQDEALPLEVVIVGNRQRRPFFCNTTNLQNQCDELYDRQKDFISLADQQLMRSLRVIQVGAGGTGSIMAEALCRTGIGHLHIIDHDKVEISNLNRLQGFSTDEEGCTKAQRLSQHIKNYLPQADVSFSTTNIFALANSPETFMNADVIVSCVDDDLVRHVLGCLASHYMLPLFDCSSLVTMDNDKVDFISRHYRFIPGITGCHSCLSTIKILDTDKIGQAFTNPLTHSNMQKAGYIKDSTANSPSVYSVNMQSVAIAHMEIINHITGWRPPVLAHITSWRAGAQRYEFMAHQHGPKHNCPVCGFSAGLGSSAYVPVPTAHSDQEQVFFKDLPQILTKYFQDQVKATP